VKDILSKTAIALYLLLTAAGLASAQDYVQLPAAIHVSTDISDGKLSLEEIAAIARNNGIAVLIPTDRDSMAWEYGIAPLRNILKKRVTEKSVFSYGVKRYFQRIEALKRSYPGLIVIPGLESAPYYYWQGSVFNDDLVIRDWHKHMLVLGLSRPVDLEYLPVLGNPKGLWLPLGVRSVLLAWPLLLAAFGIWCMRKRVYHYADSSGRSLGSYSRSWRIFGIIVFCTAVIFFANNYPFMYQKFDQYHGSRGIMPYQNLIDYVNSRGGLTFWPHPESSNVDKAGPVGIETDEYSDHLLTTHGYTGFAIFYEGYKRVGAVGGIWDRILIEHCRGMRQSALWAIAGLAFDKTGDLGSRMNDVRTVLLSSASTESAALDALKKGRMYCMRGKGSDAFVLDAFTVSDAGKNAKTMGEELRSNNAPAIRIAGHLLRGQDKTFTIQLIKDGTLLRVFEAVSPFDMSYVDAATSSPQKSYYRVQITAQDITVISNPVFVQR
jgi:hypothetical protein